MSERKMSGAVGAASADMVAHALEEDIIFGRLEPAAKIPEEEVAERLGASRHHVREALARLEHIGIVERQRHRGATVRSFTTEEVDQIYEVREMLQRQAALRIPIPLDAEARHPIEQAQAAYVDAIDKMDLRGIHEANDRFHTAFFLLCGNEYLLNLIKQYMDLTYTIRAKNLANSDGLRLSLQQHDLMIRLLKGNDSWSLAQLCVDHIQPSKKDYLQSLAEREAARPVRRRRRRPQ